MFIGSVGALVKLTSTTHDSQVLGYCNLAVAKIATNHTNSAVLTEEGIIPHLARIILRSRERLANLIIRMISTTHQNQTQNNDEEIKSFSEVHFESCGIRKRISLISPVFNLKLQEILFVLANTAVAIGELCRFGNNRVLFFEHGVLEPLMDCLKLHGFMQQHFDANYHKNEYENAAMVEIMGRHQIILEGSGRSKLNNHLMGIPFPEIVTNPKLDDMSPYSCNSNICSPNGDKSYSQDLDCYYHHIFRNTAYALSQMSEDETVSKTLRSWNSVSIMVKLLNSKNDALQLAAAKTISNIRRIYINKSVLGNDKTTNEEMRLNASKKDSQSNMDPKTAGQLFSD